MTQQNFRYIRHIPPFSIRESSSDWQKSILRQQRDWDWPPVHPDSPAGEAGLLVGDRVVSKDNQLPMNIDGDNMRAMLRKDGKIMFRIRPHSRN
ncbi:MAG: PDZ domain-containing protein [Candidatus Zixiibacteriota bacterium]